MWQGTEYYTSGGESVYAPGKDLTKASNFIFLGKREYDGGFCVGGVKKTQDTLCLGSLESILLQEFLFVGRILVGTILKLTLFFFGHGTSAHVFFEYFPR